LARLVSQIVSALVGPTYQFSAECFPLEIAANSLLN